MRTVWFAACSIFLACARPEPATPARAVAALQVEEAEHLLITVEVAAGQARTIDARKVALPRPELRGPVHPQPWRVVVEDRSGAVLFEEGLAAADVVRAEFAGPDGKI